MFNHAENHVMAQQFFCHVIKLIGETHYFLAAADIRNNICAGFINTAENAVYLLFRYRQIILRADDNVKPGSCNLPHFFGGKAKRRLHQRHFGIVVVAFNNTRVAQNTDNTRRFTYNGNTFRRIAQIQVFLCFFKSYRRFSLCNINCVGNYILLLQSRKLRSGSSAVQKLTPRSGINKPFVVKFLQGSVKNYQRSNTGIFKIFQYGIKRQAFPVGKLLQAFVFHSHFYGIVFFFYFISAVIKP